VYLGKSDGEVLANTNEIAAIRYVRPESLHEEIGANADLYTPWFKMEWQRLRDDFGERLREYWRSPS
jgi:isopentenyl-diphosphate delta-isomerase